MKHVVITGGTRGIGSGMVRGFLKKGYRITFSGKSDSTVSETMDSLSQDWDTSLYKGVVSDISQPDDINTLWDFGTSIFGTVDIWINNAGITNERNMFGNLDIEKVSRLIDTNIKGVVTATHTVFNRMKKQGGGFIYNMGGLGSDGRMISGLTPYGMSKKAVQYFTMAFSREIETENVKVGLLLPGMVLTDLLLDPIRKNREGSENQKRIFNILADEVEPVTGWLVDRILENDRNGKVISYMSKWKVAIRFLSAPFTGRDIVSKNL